MNFHNLNLQTLTFVTRILANRELRFILPLIFANFTYLRLKRLLGMQLRLRAVPDEALQLALNREPRQNNYVDSYCRVLASKELAREEKTTWYYICCASSSKKYKVSISASDNIHGDELVMSETMLFNVQNHLKIRSDLDATRYFIITASDPDEGIAEEAALSLISNPNDCPEDLLDSLLRNYFSSARYLRSNDVLSIDVRRFAPGHQFLMSRDNCKALHFKISDLKVDKLSQNPRKGCFVVQGVTTLLQKPNTPSYLPRRNLLSAHGREEKTLDVLAADDFLSNCPPCLEDPLKSLVDCISPFVQIDTFVDVRPVFLVKGVEGSGKSTLVRMAAQRMGLNFLSVDFSEIQSLTSAQTEAKLRIVLHNAKVCVPCVLSLGNIQIFGKDAEGKEDERIISSFAIELKNFFNKIDSPFPLVVVATADDSVIPASLQQVFVETIKMENLSHGQRFDTLKWLMDNKGFQTEADFSHIASICTDFVLADLNAIVLHAAKIRAGLFYSRVEEPKSLILMQDDFSKAHEYMQSRYSDWIGAPRVPKVNWEDIGGLGDLKNEIMRRIELPLLTSDSIGLSRSGLLLYGPPGTGKTLLAKAVATECQVHFLSVKGPELLNMYVGQSEKNVRQVFEIARSSAPCVIFFDELDSLAPNRGRSGDSGGVMDRVVSQLLAEIDGVDSTGSVFVIGATNRPDLIDPALLRPGRFDKLLYVGISSDRASKLSILKAQTRRFELLENGEELNDVVDVLPENITGADIYAVCSNAWLFAVRRKLQGRKETEHNIDDRVIVTREDFVKAATNVVPSVGEEELKRYEKLRAELSPVVR